MANSRGVEEALSQEALNKREVNPAVRGMSENVMAAETDVAGVARDLDRRSARTSPRLSRRRSS